MILDEYKIKKQDSRAEKMDSTMISVQAAKSCIVLVMSSRDYYLNSAAGK